MRILPPIWLGCQIGLSAWSSAALRHFGVDTILVGHTIVPEVTPLYGGKVIAVQVYPRRDEDTGEALLGAVLREGGRWYRAGVEGTRVPLALE